MLEIEVLDRLKSGRFLEPLVFIGGTMLRLCHELDRYSVDLDFWIIKKIDQAEYFNKLKKDLSRGYEIVDACVKASTMLIELKSSEYPKKLKLEIRKELKDVRQEERIAYSRYSNRQVILRVHTLEGTMRSKIEAITDRKEVRDAFDIEFLLRKGVSIADVEIAKLLAVKKVVSAFKPNDFKVKLGSILDPETRKYYIEHKFEYLIGKINSIVISQ